MKQEVCKQLEKSGLKTGVLLLKGDLAYLEIYTLEQLKEIRTRLDEAINEKANGN